MGARPEQWDGCDCTGAEAVCCDVDPKGTWKIATMPSRSAPGPKYMLPRLVGRDNHDICKKRGPAYTIAGKSTYERRWAGPGPKYALDMGLTNRGPPSQRTVKMKYRHFYEGKRFGPGPKYDIDNEQDHRTPPAFSFGERTKMIQAGKGTPGPIYDPYISKKCHGVKLGWKLEHGSFFNYGNSSSPGPACVNLAGRADVIKRRAPVVAIKDMIPVREKVSCAPGPKYFPNFIECSGGQKGTSLAGRHSDAVAPIVYETTDCT